MNLGDVARKTVPKMCLVSAPRHGGSIATATFIPHRVHEAIGVLGAVSVATACVIPGSVAARSRGCRRRLAATRGRASRADSSRSRWKSKSRQNIAVRRAALLRTARKLMRGEVFVPGAVWSRA